MTFEITKTIWECPYCSNEYDNEEDAQDCADGCSEIDAPTESEITKYGCDMCRKEYVEELNAEDCEEKHTKNKDRHLKEYGDWKEKAKLLEAGNHKNQKKLVEETKNDS